MPRCRYTFSKKKDTKTQKSERERIGVSEQIEKKNNKYRLTVACIKTKKQQSIGKKLKLLHVIYLKKKMYNNSINRVPETNFG